MSIGKAAKKTGKKGILILLATLAFYTLGFAPGIAITVTGSWSLSIGQANLSGAAGSDLTASYESNTNQLLMTISGTSGSWRVDVYRVDSTWHTSFVLSIKRTGSGTPPTKGTYSINPIGLTYGPITTSATTFWSGTNSFTNIPLQYQLSGVSCAVPAASYSTTVYFTVVQTN